MPHKSAAAVNIRFSAPKSIKKIYLLLGSFNLVLKIPGEKKKYIDKKISLLVERLHLF